MSGICGTKSDVALTGLYIYTIRNVVRCPTLMNVRLSALRKPSKVHEIHD